MEMDGNPLVTAAAAMSISCKTVHGLEAHEVTEAAKARCMVSCSLSRSIPTTIPMAV